MLSNKKIIIDYQDFSLATEARPKTAGRVVAQFMSACWWPKKSFQYNWKLKFVDLKYTDFEDYNTINMF